ncbi:MAG TPA: ABC transporter permease [Gemmatimonadaceae bacterium]|jgi:putative ABC transport system permease protein
MSLSSKIFNVAEGVGIAFDAIRSNKVRAALTILGVAVGVFVVVALSAAIHGINVSVAKDFESAGPTSFFVYRFPASLSTVCDGTEDTCTWRRNPPLTMGELGAISRLPEIERVTAHVGSRATIKYKNREVKSVGTDGYEASWLEVDGGDIVAGRTFTQGENNSTAHVVVINTFLAKELFKGADPIDKLVSLDGQQFQVIGVHYNQTSFLGKPTSSATGNDPRMIAPINTVSRVLDVGWRSMDFTVKPRKTVSQPEAIDAVTMTLRGQRGLRPGAPDNFAIMTSDNLLNIYNGFFGVFFVVMIALSAVGLMVGGVGVVAIMMISVTERTREIGVRKALGATRKTILWQFLVEAATLTCIGATIGLIGGSAVAYIVNRFTPVPASTPGGAIAAALIVSAITGIVFGLLPAMRASKLDPVEALRYE